MNQILIGIAATTIAFGSGWTVHGWKTDADMKKAIEAHNEQIIEKGIEHDTNQGIINSLSLAASTTPRVRIKFRPCKEAANQDGEARAFSARVDKEFGRLQERVGALMLRCDLLNIDAIRSND
tara:strand:- start:634 stop:1002 length:369 start_codon:yes stop_codon:yes gene_type:complete